jgi:hypothetical protein
VKNKICLILGIFILAFWILKCDREKAFEPDPSINQATSGQGIFINESDMKAQGLEVLVVNVGDTVKLEATTILLNQPSYSWSSGNQSVLKLISDPGTSKIVYAVATADSGASTSLNIKDSGNNNAGKTIPVYISKYWADSDRFTFLGSIGKHFYYISTDIKTWSQADVICDEAGGHLVSITSTEEQNFLAEARGAIENVWIGVRFNKNASDNWVVDTWVTGEEISYRNFIGNTNDPGIFAEFFFFMDVNGQGESWHEISYQYFMEME